MLNVYLLAFAAFLAFALDDRKKTDASLSVTRSSEWSLQHLEDNEDDDVADSVLKIEAALGRTANLPCQIRNDDDDDDRVYMVLWFKKSFEKPIYSFDARGRSFSKALHWSDNNTLGPRAYFVTSVPRPNLLIEPVQLQDEGIYRCRVDFKNAPTKNFQINLAIVVPPHQMIVFDSSGREVMEIVGPINENSDMIITCEVRGGKPKPNLVWTKYDRKKVIVNSTHFESNVAISKLEIKNISREYMDMEYVCIARNSKSIEPMVKRIIIKLNLKPLKVEISPKLSEVYAGRPTEISCCSEGSKPAATILWYKNNTKLILGNIGDKQWVRKNEIIGTHQNPKTNNIIIFHADPKENGELIQCRALNAKIDGFFLEDSFRLNVVYPPIVKMQLGSNLNIDNIKEGDDVYFECIVKSNPEILKINWFHNDNPVIHNMSSRKIISRNNLVLQLVNRQSSGFYMCSVSNKVGSTNSEKIELRVKHAPICVRDEDPLMIGASLGETVNVDCEVKADPFEEIKFRWIFNNSENSFMVPNHKYTVYDFIRSKLIYTLASNKDYGSLSCFAQNSIGEQATPCIYRVVPAAHPTELKNCTTQTILNTSMDALEIRCIAGYNGGLEQEFHLEVANNSSTLLNITSTKYPLFYIDLSSFSRTRRHLSLTFFLYSSNRKGNSKRITLEYNLHSEAQRNNAEFSLNEDNDITAALKKRIGLIAIATVVIILLVIGIVIRKRLKNHYTNNTNSHLSNGNIKKLDLRHCEDDQEYVISYQIKCEPNQPDILNRAAEEPDNASPHVIVNKVCNGLLVDLKPQDKKLMEPEIQKSQSSVIQFPHKSTISSDRKPPKNSTKSDDNEILTSAILGPESRV